jgi:hypothetical protein
LGEGYDTYYINKEKICYIVTSYSTNSVAMIEECVLPRDFKFDMRVFEDTVNNFTRRSWRREV